MNSNNIKSNQEIRQRKIPKSASVNAKSKGELRESLSRLIKFQDAAFNKGDEELANLLGMQIASALNEINDNESIDDEIKEEPQALVNIADGLTETENLADNDVELPLIDENISALEELKQEISTGNGLAASLIPIVNTNFITDIPYKKAGSEANFAMTLVGLPKPSESLSRLDVFDWALKCSCNTYQTYELYGAIGALGCLRYQSNGDDLESREIDLRLDNLSPDFGIHIKQLDNADPFNLWLAIKESCEKGNPLCITNSNSEGLLIGFDELHRRITWLEMKSNDRLQAKALDFQSALTLWGKWYSVEYVKTDQPGISVILDWVGDLAVQNLRPAMKGLSPKYPFAECFAGAGVFLNWGKAIAAQGKVSDDDYQRAVRYNKIFKMAYEFILSAASGLDKGHARALLTIGNRLNELALKDLEPFIAIANQNPADIKKLLKCLSRAHQRLNDITKLMLSLYIESYNITHEVKRLLIHNKFKKMTKPLLDELYKIASSNPRNLRVFALRYIGLSDEAKADEIIKEGLRDPDYLVATASLDTIRMNPTFERGEILKKSFDDLLITHFNGSAPFSRVLILVCSELLKYTAKDFLQKINLQAEHYDTEPDLLRSIIAKIL